MALSTKLYAYSDIQSVLEAVVAAGGGRILLDTKGMATRWKQRANYYRKLLHKTQSDNGITTTSTPYDIYQFCSDPTEPRAVIIRALEFRGTFETPDGKVKSISSLAPPENIDAVVTPKDENQDELLRGAVSFASGLKGDK